MSGSVFLSGKRKLLETDGVTGSHSFTGVAFAAVMTLVIVFCTAVSTFLLFAWLVLEIYTKQRVLLFCF